MRRSGDICRDTAEALSEMKVPKTGKLLSVKQLNLGAVSELVSQLTKLIRYRSLTQTRPIVTVTKDLLQGGDDHETDTDTARTSRCGSRL